MNLLHKSHPGNNRMKGLACSFIWWPGIDQQIEETVKSCDVCQKTRHSPPPVPLHPWEFPDAPWEFPDAPWERLHADFAGPFLGKMFLVVINVYSKWMEVKCLPMATFSTTIEQFRAIFATHGLSKKLVTDNGTQFTSTEFESFMRNNGICHIK